MFRVATAALLALYPTPFLTGVRAQEEAELDDEVRPAPPSIGADVPLAYFGPAPSSVDKRLVGPVQLLLAGVIDEDMGTIELPLYTGYYKDGESGVLLLLTVCRCRYCYSIQKVCTAAVCMWCLHKCDLKPPWWFYT